LLTELFARDSEHPHIKVVPMVQNEVYQWGAAIVAEL
jgi:hypothetical protein